MKGWSAFFFLALITGCAATSTTIVDEELVTNQKPMSSYKTLIITDFTLKQGADVSTSGIGSDERRYDQVPAQLAEQILRYVKSKNIYQEVSFDGTPTDTTLVMKGKFTKMGRFRISYEAFLLDGGSLQEVAYFRHTLWDVFDTTEGIGRLAREVASFIDRIQYK
ncbi:MAG TPA: hypothetical protein VGJ93_13175 [Desulfuromonadaceae bacterium]|jgi:hypothetical protein